MYSNDELNSFLDEFANYDAGEDIRTWGKRVPYIGWFWRHTDFENKSIHIGDCGKFIGVMENNKWDYPERDLTDDEASEVTDFVEVAYELYLEGNVEAAKNKLAELWDLFQTFKIKSCLKKLGSKNVWTS